MKLQEEINLKPNSTCVEDLDTPIELEKKLRSECIQGGKEKNTVFGWEEGKPENLRRKYMKEKKSTSTYKD